MRGLLIVILSLFLSGGLYAQDVGLEIRVYLEGPWFNGQMTPFLNVLGYLPEEQPYDAPPWEYAGEEAVTGLPSPLIVDWVLVDLLVPEESDEAITFNLFFRRAGFLMKDGYIKDLDGQSNMEAAMPAGDYYIRVQHRNHMPVVSSMAVPVAGGMLNYDFTTGPDKYLGGEHGCVQLGTDVWGMPSADGDNSGSIDNRDKNDVWLMDYGNSGYLDGDYNMDSETDEDDKVILWESNVGKTVAEHHVNIHVFEACGDVLIDVRDFRAYSTIQIGEQCWMGENMNIGTRIDGVVDQADNGIIEKYCYDDQEENCDTYGGLYQWDEVMDYTNQEGTQGICPEGWHVPTDDEFCELENFVDQGTVPCTATGTWQGIDCGTQLKEGGSSGFDFLISGSKEYMTDIFHYLGERGYLWTTSPKPSDPTYKIYRRADPDQGGTWRYSCLPSYGFPVRCLKDPDPVNQPPEAPYSPEPEDGSENVGVDTTLHWACSDPEGDPLMYSIYLGHTDDPPLVLANHPDTVFDPVMLKHNAVYFWKIVATDIHGDSTAGPVWTFSTSEWICGDSFTDDRDGQVYPTVSLGDQCWMAANMNIGEQINGVVDQSDNGTIEKYCYDDLESNCETYGGLYQWPEAMDYTTQEGTQGICPDGWHLPADAEWCELENFVDEGTVSCSAHGVWRGIDCGTELKEEGSTGFDFLIAGSKEYQTDLFQYLEVRGYCWTTSPKPSDPTYKLYRRVDPDQTGVWRYSCLPSYGFSVRCLKDTD